MLKFYIFGLIFSVVTATFCAYRAPMRGRSSLLWLIVGLLAPLFGAFLLELLPPVEEKKNFDFSLLEGKWYYLDSEKNQKGPVSCEELKEQFLFKKITLNTFVWCKGMAGWEVVYKINDLKRYFER